MYRVNFTVNAAVTPANNNPSCLFQALAAANHRITILALDIGVQGGTPSTAPILMDWSLQTSAGTGGDAATARYNDRGIDEVAEGTFLDGPWDSGLEPTASTVICRFQCHEQGTVRWVPPFPIIVKGGERVGLNYRGTNYKAVSFTVHMAE